MVARGVRSRAVRAHPFSDRLYSAPVRYDDHLQRNWFYRSWSPEPLPPLNSRAGISILLVKAAAPAVGRQVLVMSALGQAEHAFSAALARINVQDLAHSAAALRNLAGPHD
jgi:hypothetical protein